MLYERYYRKTLKWATVLAVLKKYKVLIISCLLAVIAAVTAYMGVYGMVYSSSECPTEIVYGQSLDYEAKSLFTKVTYEYSVAGEDEWTTEFPQSAGSYEVRSVTTSIFGSARYGIVYAFTVLPKEVEVYVSGSTVTYGETPAVTAEVEYGDSVQCTSFTYGDITASSTTVQPDLDGVVIYNESGNDVTSNYTVTTKQTEISFTKRAITITVDDAEKVYDGTALTCGDYAITGGSLAFEDSITSAIAEQSTITDAGTAQNTLDIDIYTQDGKKVSGNYNINIVAGTLTVTKRTVEVTTDGGEWTYDGASHTAENYTLAAADNTTGVLDGHTITASSYTTVTLAGTYSNSATFAITDAGGADVTANYDIQVTEGTLTVGKKAVTVTTESAKKVYDGTYLANNDCTVDGIAEGQEWQAFAYPSITNVGSTENSVTLRIYAGETEVTSNYDITYNYGTLTVTVRNITFSTEDATFTYNGGEQYYVSYEITDGDGLAGGQKEEVISYTTVTNVSESGTENVLGFVIYDAYGEDVTANYNISYEYGTLTVNKRKVTLDTSSYEWTYDGCEHTCTDYSISAESENDFADGQLLDITASSGITAVGTATNSFTVYCIYAEDGATDVSDNYSIDFGICGTLTVLQRDITITTDSATKTYDGTALTCDGYNTDNLVDGHEVSLTFTGSRINAGSSENTVDETATVIEDGNGNIVTDNYNINYQCGTLTVEKRSITVSTEGGTWTYDGTAHSNTVYTVAEATSADDGLVEGHEVSLKFTGLQLDAGESQNTVDETATVIEDGNGNIVTDNYNINYQCGTLTVEKRSVTVTTGSQSWVYDGYQHDYTQFVVAATSEYGFVDGHTFSAKTYSGITDVGERDNEFYTYEITDSSGSTVSEYGNNLADNYNISYESGTLTVTARPITVTTGTASFVYNGEAQYYDYYEISGEYGIVSWHTPQVADYGAITTVTNISEGIVENIFEIAIYDGENNVTANYNITYINGTVQITARPITVTTGTTTFVYNGEAQSYDYYEISGEYGIVSGQTAKVADYGAITTVTNVSQGIVANIFEIAIYDGENNVTANYNITYINGTVQITARSITVTAGSDSKMYDGTALTCKDYTTYNLVSGHTLTAETSGSITYVGTVDNTIVEGSVAVTDGNGIDVKANYSMTYVSGTLEITPRPFTLTTNSDKKVYDGTALENSDYTVSGYGKADGDFMKINVTGSQTDVGESYNYATVTITNGGADVTYCYSITYDYGTLEVTARPVTITTDSATMTYDGTALTCGGCSTDNLVGGHAVTLAFTGSQTNAGSSKNTVDETATVIKDGNGNNVTANYNISYVYGTLTVEKRSITVTAGDVEFTYNGEQQGSDEYTIGGDGIVSGQVVLASATYVTNVSESGTQNALTIRIYSSEEDVTSNYDITYSYGAITVLPREITVTAGSNSWEYDGEEHTWEGVSADNLVSNHTITAKTSGSITDVGTADNAVVEGSVAITDGNGIDVTANYSMRYVSGTLTVTQRTLNITLTDASKTYDGTELISTEYTQAGLLEGQKVELTADGSQTDAGSSSNNITDIKIYDGDTDVTDNYIINTYSGTLTVTVREIAIATYDAIKEYDTMALTYDKWDLAEGTVADGQELVVKVTGSQTVVGTSSNTAEVTVLDINKNDVTINYIINYYSVGTLTVTPIYITVTTGSASKEYDGTALKYENSFKYSELSSAYSSTLEINGTVTGSQTVVGTSSNTVVVTVIDDYNFSIPYDITQYCEITYNLGTLTVTYREVTIQTYTATFEYDGTEKYCDDFYAVSGSIADNQTAKVINHTTLINAGTEDNVLEIAIYDAEGNNVTSNYTIGFTTYGTLTVEAREIIVTAGSDSKNYDGFALTCSKVSADNLADGHTITATTSGTITEEGSAENTVVEGTVVINDADGNDVTANYLITGYVSGTLTVYNVEVVTITVSTKSDSKVYDGSALTNTVGSSSGTLKSGHTISLKVTGSQTDVGSSENTIEVTIIDADEKDVTSTYNIVYNLGTLTVTAIDITVATDSDSKTYDSTALTCHSYTEVTNLLSGHELSVAFTGSQTAAGSSDNTATAVVLDDNGADVSKYYNISYDYGTLTVEKRDIGISTGTMYWTYDGYEHCDGDYSQLDYDQTDSTAGEENYGLLNGHTLSYELYYVKGVLLDVYGNVVSYENQLKFTIYDANGIDVTKNYNILYSYGTLTIYKREITLVTGSAEKEYDGTELVCESVETSGNGFAADHTPLILTNTTITNVEYDGDSVTGIDNVLTVAIYDGDNNDVSSNYTITYSYGLLIVLPRAITVTAGSDYKSYDGTPLTCQDIYADNLVSGHTIAGETEGSQTDVGQSDNLVVRDSIIITDASGEDVTLNYTVTEWVAGSLIVTKQEITITANSGTWYYDGEEHTSATYYVSGLIDGQDNLNFNGFEVIGSQTEAGSSANTIVGSAVIYDGDNNDITDNFEIYYADGTLTVLPRPVAVTTGGGEWTYDGTAHSNTDYTLLSYADYAAEYATLYGYVAEADYGLLDDLFGIYAVAYEVTDAGEYANTLAFTIINSAGKDVSANYDIIYAECGTLIISQRDISVTTGDYTWLCDGLTHYYTGYTVTDGEFVEDHTVSVADCTYITDAGTTENALALTVRDANGNIVTANYNITFTNGTLEVFDPLALEEGESYVYNVQYSGWYSFTVTEGEFTIDIGGEVYTFAADGVSQEIGLYDGNVVTITANEYGSLTLRFTEEFATIDLNDGESYEYPVDTDGTYTIDVLEGVIYVNINGTEYTVTPDNPLKVELSENDEVTITAGEDSTFSITDTSQSGGEQGDGSISLSDGDTYEYTANEDGTYTFTVTEGEISFTYDGFDYTVSAATGSASIDLSAGDILDITANGDSTFKADYSSGGEQGGESIDLSTGDTYEYNAEEDGTYTFIVEEGSLTVEIGGKEYTVTPDNPLEIELSEGDIANITANEDSTFSVDGSGSGSGGGSGSGSGGLDTSGNIGGGGYSGDETVFLYVTSDTSGELYFKLISYGDYNGSGWESATEYGATINIEGTEYSLSYLIALILEENGITASEVTIQLNVNDYVLPYYTLNGGDVQSSDVSYSGASTQYTLYVYYCDLLQYYEDGLTVSDAYSQIEALYSAFVYENYLSVPESTLEYLNTVIEEQGFKDITDTCELITAVATYVQNAATYNLGYDTALDSEEDVVVAFLSTYKEGICQHYASAATLLYRALGLPARYTIGYYGSTTAGVMSEIATAHAWTEVYINGFGWVMVEVTGSDGSGGGGGGTEDDQPLGTLTIKPADVVNTYDGTTIYAESIAGADDDSAYLLTELLNKGYTYYAEYSGSQTDVGASASTITAFILYDENGNNVTSKYTIHYEDGLLTVTTDTVITVYLYEVTKYYDGTALSYEDGDYYWNESGYTVVIENLSSVSLTDAGRISVNDVYALHITVTDAAGTIVYDNENGIYNVYLEIDATDLLTIYKRDITVTSASATKTYDGEALSDDTCYISGGNLLSGDYIVAVTSGSITDAGTVENTITSVTVYDSNDKNVTANYNITYVYGLLTVTDE